MPPLIMQHDAKLIAMMLLNLHYRSGKCNIEADALSRIPWTKRYDKLIDESMMKAIIDVGTVTNHSNTAVEFSSALQHEINLGAGKIAPSKMTKNGLKNKCPIQ